MPNAIRTHAGTSDKIDAPAGCATLSATRPFHFVHTARVLQREREMLASTIHACTRSMPSLLSYYLVHSIIFVLNCSVHLHNTRTSSDLYLVNNVNTLRA